MALLHLNATTHKLQVVTSSTAGIDVLASYADYSASGVAIPSSSPDLTKITTATTTDVVVAPAASTTRGITSLFISNIHASTANTVTIQFTDGTNTVALETVTLQAGERIALREGVPMRIVTAGGYERTIADARPAQAATTAQIAAHSADTYYLGVPVTGRLQAGSWFRWTWRSNKGAAGTVAPIYTIRFGTAGTTADTARVTVTGAAQTAATDEGYWVVEANFRSVGASAVLVGQVALWHRLGTTGFSTTAANVFATPVVSSAFDSTVVNSIIGLSVNPGTSGAWVTDLVTLESGNLIP